MNNALGIENKVGNEHSNTELQFTKFHEAPQEIFGKLEQFLHEHNLF